MNATYEVVEGSEPSTEAQHEPRTMKQFRNGELVLMLTEIEDGMFVGWDQCNRCHRSIKSCSCSTGPEASATVQRWREQRFTNSIQHRRAAENTSEVDQPAASSQVPQQPEFEPEPDRRVEPQAEPEPQAPSEQRTREDIVDVGF